MAVVGLTLLSPRQELPYHLEQLLDNNRLTRCLLEWEVFGRLFNEDFSIDLLRSWQKVKKAAAIIEPMTKFKFFFFDAVDYFATWAETFSFPNSKQLLWASAFLLPNQRAICYYDTFRCQAAPLLRPRAYATLSRVEFELNCFVPIKKPVARMPCACS